MKYLQVCRAVYDYQPTTADEININENDILYVINMDDENWWKVEIKQVSIEQTGPIGLVPATYLEEVAPIGKVRAEYDYDTQQDEEISFGEGQELWLLERDDPDWYLVKLGNGNIGLAPSNYIQIIDATNQLHQQRMENTTTTETSSASTPATPNIVPTTVQQSIQTQREFKDINDEAQSWTVYEYDVAKKKKKKGKGNLLVGNAMLCYGSETDKTSPVQQYPILDVSKYLFNGKNLHIEIDGTNPAVLDLQASSKSEAKAMVVKITDSRKTAQETATHISQRISATPINTLPGSANNNINGSATVEPRWATSLYAFEAEGGEELSIGENQRILVMDYDRDDGWWRVTTVDGKSGIIPSSYIQFYDDGANQDRATGMGTGDNGVDSAASDEVEAYIQRQKEQQSSDRRENQRMDEQQHNVDQQTRDEQEWERRRRVQEAAQFAELTRQRQMDEERIRRESGPRSSSMSPNESNNGLSRSTSTRQNLPKPDPDRLRTWTDRSGSFKVEAQFLALMDGKLRLHKANGVKIDVPLEKMSAEDIRWVERRRPVGSTTKQLNQEKTPEMPPRPNPSAATPDKRPDKSGSARGRKPTNTNWDWFDWFMKIGIPMQEALVYSSAFKADNLDDDDLSRLTHKQIKTLGIQEKHVQRMERYIDTGNVEPPSDSEEHNDTKQDYVARQKQIETDEEMAKRLQKSWNESGGNRGSSSTPLSTKTKYSESTQKEIHPDLLDFLGSGSTPSNNEQPIKNTSGGHSDLIGFSDDAWTPRPVNEANRIHNQQPQLVQTITQRASPSPMDITSQESPTASTPTYQQRTATTPTQSTMSTTLPQKAKTVDSTLHQWQGNSISGDIPKLGNNQRPSLNQLSQQKQLRKYQQQQRQQSLLDQQQQIIMQQQQQIQQQQIHQQQIQLQQQHRQNHLLQQTTGYQQPINTNSLVMHNSGSMASQQQLPQITGYIQPQQHQMTGFIHQQQHQSQLLQPTELSAADQLMYQHQQQIPPTQPRGRDWNSSTPDNPFGSPTKPHTQTTIGPGALQFSTPGLSAFTQSPIQSVTTPAYLQQLQPQMTGIQQTELSGARDKYAAFRSPNADVFTPSGSMQHGQSAFPQNSQQYGQHW